MESPPLRALLIVDADARFREGLAFAFRRAGLEARLTGEAREVVELARGCQAVIAGPSLGTRALAALVEALRRTQRAAPSVLAVGPAERREEALAAGAVEHVGAPAYLHDLVTLARLAAAGALGAARAMTGAIEDHGVYLLARALCAARRSARVRLLRPSSTGNRHGELLITQGRLAAARAGRQRGVGAFLQLLAWEAGGLCVEFSQGENMPAPSSEAGAIARPTERLFDDGLRFLSQLRSAAARVGGLHAVYRRDERRLVEARRQIPAQVLSFLERYDGERSVLELVEDAPFRPLDTLMITYRLVELEIIAPRTDPAHDVARALRAKRAVREWLRELSPVSETSRDARDQGAEATSAPETPRRAPATRATKTSPAEEPADEDAPILLLRERIDPAIARSSSVPLQPRTKPEPARRPAPTAPVVAKPAAEPSPATDQAVPTPIASEPTRPLPIAVPTATPTPRPAQRPSSMADQTAPRSRRELDRHSRETVRLPLVAFDSLDEEFFAGEAALGDENERFDEQDDPSDEVRRWFGRARRRR